MSETLAYRAFTVKRCWAEKIASGAKIYEFRNFRTDYRGPVVVTISGEMISFCIVDLVGIVASNTVSNSSPEELAYGRYAWQLANARRCEPLPVRGQLGLWHWIGDLPHVINGEIKMTTQLSLFGDCDQSIQDKKPVRPQDAQLSMFAGSELAQFGVKANPIMPIPQDCTARLALEIQDIRTPEQKESDLRHDAESLTVPLPESAPAPESQIPDYDFPAEAWQPALLANTFTLMDRFGRFVGVLSSDPLRYQSDTEEWCA